ncbi:hypothetical protein Bbelb_269850 [Branchiostoma belcheri]|nr:hypothetical protein Bbelb_269850 [Branchiostoma belcheri]
MTVRDDGGGNGAGDAERWVQAESALDLRVAAFISRNTAIHVNLFQVRRVASMAAASRSGGRADVRLLNSPHPQPHEQQDFQAAAPPGGMHQNCTHYFGTGERFMFGLVFTAGRSRLARRRHRIEGARPLDPWRATIIQAENWAEYLGVELSSALRMHATALSVFFSCRYTLPVGASNTPPTGRALPVPVFRYIPGSSTDLSAENSNKVRTATLATARDTSGILKNCTSPPPGKYRTVP